MFNLEERITGGDESHLPAPDVIKWKMEQSCSVRFRRQDEEVQGEISGKQTSTAGKRELSNN